MLLPLIKTLTFKNPFFEGGISFEGQMEHRTPRDTNLKVKNFVKHKKRRSTKKKQKKCNKEADKTEPGGLMIQVGGGGGGVGYSR